MMVSATLHIKNGFTGKKKKTNTFSSTHFFKAYFLTLFSSYPPLFFACLPPSPSILDFPLPVFLSGKRDLTSGAVITQDSLINAWRVRWDISDGQAGENAAACAGCHRVCWRSYWLISVKLDLPQK